MEERIKLVQKFFDLEQDGILGKETRKSLEIFQFVNNIEVSGELDDETYYLIYDYLNIRQCFRHYLLIFDKLYVYKK